MNAINEFELHLDTDPELVKKWGKKIKQAGGRYSHCRGYSDTRYVHIPTTTVGMSIGDALINEFGYKKVCVVARSREMHLPANVSVSYVSRPYASLVKVLKVVNIRIENWANKGKPVY